MSLCDSTIACFSGQMTLSRNEAWYLRNIVENPLRLGLYKDKFRSELGTFIYVNIMRIVEEERLNKSDNDGAARLSDHDPVTESFGRWLNEQTPEVRSYVEDQIARISGDMAGPPDPEPDEVSQIKVDMWVDVFYDKFDRFGNPNNRGSMFPEPSRVVAQEFTRHHYGVHHGNYEWKFRLCRPDGTLRPSWYPELSLKPTPDHRIPLRGSAATSINAGHGIEQVSGRPPIHQAMFHGLAGTIVEASQPYTEAHPVAVLASVLVTFGVVIGARPRFSFGTEEAFTNEFAVLAGETSKARKGTSWKVIEKILEKADPNFVEEHIIDGLASGEGLVSRIRDGRGVDPGVSDKRLLVQEQELTDVLRKIKRDGNTLQENLCKVFDHRRKIENNSKGRPESVTGAHIGILAHCTIERLRKTFDEGLAHQGFGNRFLYLAVSRARILPYPESMPENKISELADEFRKAVEFGKGVDHMSWSLDAERARDDWYRGADDKPGLVGVLLARGEAHVPRLAMIYALLDCSAVIGLEHFNAALALWDYAVQSVEHIFGNAQTDSTEDRLVRWITDEHWPLTKTYISKKFNNHVSGPELADIRQSLEKQGKIIEVLFERKDCVRKDHHPGCACPVNDYKGWTLPHRSIWNPGDGKYWFRG